MGLYVLACTCGASCQGNTTRGLSPQQSRSNKQLDEEEEGNKAVGFGGARCAAWPVVKAPPPKKIGSGKKPQRKGSARTVSREADGRDGRPGWPLGSR
jgi:hypothetical protein